MTWPEAQRKIMWHQRRVMETPMNSRERMESIKILREMEEQTKIALSFAQESA